MMDILAHEPDEIMRQIESRASRQSATNPLHQALIKMACSGQSEEDWPHLAEFVAENRASARVRASRVC
jgi:hypothetical protein